MAFYSQNFVKLDSAAKYVWQKNKQKSEKDKTQFNKFDFLLENCMI